MHFSGLCFVNVIESDVMQHSVRDVQCQFRFGCVPPLAPLPGGHVGVDDKLKRPARFQIIAQIKADHIGRVILFQKLTMHLNHARIVHDTDINGCMINFKCLTNPPNQVFEFRHVGVQVRDEGIELDVKMPVG